MHNLLFYIRKWAESKRAVSATGIGRTGNANPASKARRERGSMRSRYRAQSKAGPGSVLRPGAMSAVAGDVANGIAPPQRPGQARQARRTVRLRIGYRRRCLRARRRSRNRCSVRAPATRKCRRATPATRRQRTARATPSRRMKKCADTRSPSRAAK